jgi:hypothetical protein
LTKIKTVDGSGSGLDACLLDGQDSSHYAPANAPTFTGVPTAPTAAAGTSTTQIATTAFVDDALNFVSETVLGAGAAYVDFTGLGGLAAGGYRLEVAIALETYGTRTLYVYVNGDTTATNYKTSTTDTPQILSYAGAGGSTNTGYVHGTLDFLLTDTRIGVLSKIGYYYPPISAASNTDTYVHYEVAISNLTSMRIAASAGNFLAGSVFRLYKKK